LRIALANALMADRRYEEAVEVLATGVELAPGNAQFKERLKLAESYVKEQKWIQRQSGQSGATGQPSAQFRKTVIRCTRLKGESALSACDTALGERPEDTRLLAARGDALFDLGRYGEAVSSYRQALNLEPGDASVTGQLNRAEVQRLKAVDDCRTLDGDDGLGACNAALLEGAGDEFTVRVRQGELLLAGGREDEALQAYRAARKLDPRNAQVQQAIETLTTPVASAKPVVPRSAVSRPAMEAKIEPEIPADREKPEQVVPPPTPPPRVVEVPPPDGETSPAQASTEDRLQAATSPAGPPVPVEPGIIEPPSSTETVPVEIAAVPAIPDSLPDIPTDGYEGRESSSPQLPEPSPRYSNAPVAPGITY